VWIRDGGRIQVHRGVLAGDRFDITSADALEEKAVNGQRVEWKDVTEETLENLKSGRENLVDRTFPLKLPFFICIDQLYRAA
jgi:hypothetical protein